MIQMTQNTFDRSRIELLLQENKLIEALALLRQCAFEGLPEQETHLYVLFARARLYGPESCEADIDALRGVSDLNDREKDLLRRIFLYAFQVAERAGQEEKKLAYQRLLRRLLLGQPLDQPIPITPKAPQPPLRVILLEPAAIVPTHAEPTLARDRDGARIR